MPKRVGNLFEKIYSMENLKEAHKNAQRGKGWYAEVQMVNNNEEYYLKLLQDSLINHTYKTSPYTMFVKHENNKDREIFKLPYFPDRICQWAILQVIEPYITKTFTKFTYSAIPGKGIHAALKDVSNAIRKDVPNCLYCLKLDARKYYPSINHKIMKEKFRRIFKDPELLWLLDEIIDSIATAKIEDMRNIWLLDEDIDEETGIPIGNYLSQYCGNYYFASFDHWLLEVKHVKHVFRYMDDIVILADSKAFLHNLKHDIDEYFRNNLKLVVKHTWQIFPTYVRGIDFVGYRMFLEFTLLRKSTKISLVKKLLKISDKVQNGNLMNYSEWCSINSYRGLLKHCDSWRLRKKYLVPLAPHARRYYKLVVKKGGSHDQSWQSTILHEAG